jgi:HB1, ASXL, restriction endonuclease HTH domain
MQTFLQRLKPGMQFRLVGMPEISGELLSCADCSAVIRIEGGTREVEFENDGGTTRRFRARRATTSAWAPATVVEPIFTPMDNASSQNEEFDMATKKSTKAKAPKAEATTKAKKAKVTNQPKDKKLSAIDAATQVLAASKEPMNAKELIEAMAAKNLWISPSGKTPWATLYSALMREIAQKRKKARFVKTELGKFAAK